MKLNTSIDAHSQIDPDQYWYAAPDGLVGALNDFRPSILRPTFRVFGIGRRGRCRSERLLEH